jgi:hypothetical protein
MTIVDRPFPVLLTLSFVVLDPISSLSQVACKPFLSVRAVREVRSSYLLPWVWNATITSDASHCATHSGTFEIDFVRIKENSPDLQFTQNFRWARKQFNISIEFSSDEAILDLRIGFIAPCACRQIDQGLFVPKAALGVSRN